jgi:hypothetical protein
MEGENKLEEKKRDYLIPVSILLSAVIVAIASVYRAGVSATPTIPNSAQNAFSPDDETANLAVKWGDLGARMVKAGVIDRAKFESIYTGGLTTDGKSLLTGTDNGGLNITKVNAGIILNLLWALGLSNKNQILENGPMMDPRYGGAGNFASTGGWTLSVGNSMDHYSMHNFIGLTPEQQALVERVSKNIYRPCCGNSAYFPDCNHGMAMLGLLELMASQGADEAAMYKSALIANSLWFADTYANISQYLAGKGMSMNSVPPQNILGAEFSSAAGYQRVVEALKPTQNSGSSCGVQ